MKKIIISTLILFLGFSIFAQDNVKLRVGQTMSDIQKVFPELKAKVDSDGDTYLFQDLPAVQIYYYFDSKKICHAQIYIQGIENTSVLLKTLNTSEYIKLSAKEYLRVDGDTVLKFIIDVSVEHGVIMLSVIRQ